MNQRTLLSRLLSPAGFGLVLLMFLLPFVTVSCGGERQITSTFTGVDMVVGSPPEIAGPGVDSDVERELVALFADDLGVEPLALLGALAVLAAMGVGLIRERLARHAISTGLAVLVAALLGSAVIRASDRVDAALHKFDDQVYQGVATATAVDTRFGFWFVMVTLALLAAGHAVGLVAAWRAAPRPQASEGEVHPQTPQVVDG